VHSISRPAARYVAVGHFFRSPGENGSENQKSLLHIPSRRFKGSAMLSPADDRKVNRLNAKRKGV
jgi:hypothetical protein